MIKETIRNKEKQKRLRKGDKNTRKNYEKDLNDPDNHDGVIIQSQTSWSVKSSGP